MQLADCLDILSAVNGCTFASLDSVSKPKAGITRIQTGANVILFGGSDSSGYETMVNKRLATAGLSPSFYAQELPWGQHVGNTALIEHNGKHYLQTIVLSLGEVKYFIGAKEVNPLSFNIRPDRVTDSRHVVVNTYTLSNITRLKLMGVEINEESSLPN